MENFSTIRKKLQHTAAFSGAFRCDCLCQLFFVMKASMACRKASPPSCSVKQANTLLFLVENIFVFAIAMLLFFSFCLEKSPRFQVSLTRRHQTFPPFSLCSSSSFFAVCYMIHFSYLQETSRLDHRFVGRDDESFSFPFFFSRLQ